MAAVRYLKALFLQSVSRRGSFQSPDRYPVRCLPHGAAYWEWTEHSVAQRYEGGCEFPEVIITNYDPKEMERSQPRQMRLFGLGEEDDEDCYEITGVWSPEREAL